MKLKIILEDFDKIKSFVSCIQMLSKLADRLIFIFSKNKLTILTEKPVMWIDIEISQYAIDYKFNGNVQDDIGMNYIYFDVKSKNILFPLEALVNSSIEHAEMSLIKNTQNVPFLKIFSKPTGDGLKGCFNSEIPVIVIPHEQWVTINVPRELSFDCSCKMPRYYIFRKYLDIYKRFKTLRFNINASTIQLEAGSEIESQVMTCFEKIRAVDDWNEPVDVRIYTVVDSKKLAGFFHSIYVLNIAKPIITCKMKNCRYMKITFQNENGLIVFNSIFEHIGEVDDNEAPGRNISDEYREEIILLDSQ